MEGRYWQHERESQLWVLQEGDIRLAVIRDRRRGHFVEVVDLGRSRFTHLKDKKKRILYWETVNSAKRNAERYGLDPEWRRLNLG